MTSLYTIILIILLCCSVCFSNYPVFPEQIHISLGNCPTERVITWVTFVETRPSFVWYGKLTEGLKNRAEGFSKKFKVRRYSKRVRHIHKVVLTDLEPCSFYAYRCGSWHGASEPFLFKVGPSHEYWSPRVLIFGDMGWKGAKVYPDIFYEAKDYDIDTIFHVGDIAYNLETFDGLIGDRFMRMIQPVASIVPYMTVVGNHEQYNNFTYYKNIFSMPGESEGLFYSFDMGPVHFIAISTEVYYFTEYGIEPLKNQYEWLKKDLQLAESNRKNRPWIIVLSHRPLYCSSDDGEECSLDQSVLRCSSFGPVNYGLEDLFYKHKVDIIFSGHMHYYERSWPLYNQRACNSSSGNPYTNAKAPVYIITGAGGMKGGPETVSQVREDWFAFHSPESSYTILTAHNKTCLHLKQISTVRGVIDSVWFSKDVLV